MERQSFLDELERRLDENRRLTEKGGLPKELAPVAQVFGFNAWQVLVGVGFVVTGVWFLVWPLELMGFVRMILLMGG